MIKELSAELMFFFTTFSILLSFSILTFFAKRQIMRFTIRSRHSPHYPIGHGISKKSIKREIGRRIDSVNKIGYEPQLIFDDPKYILKPGTALPPYYYRQRAVEDVKLLESEISKQELTRHPRDSLRSFLLTTLTNGPANGPSQRLIHQFCDMYEHARYDPSEFGDEEYQAYYRLLLKLIDSAKTIKTFNNSRKSSPSRTPVKKLSKIQPLLDPSRLRPPPAHMGGNLETRNSNTRLNMNLGLQQQQQDENEILSISHIHGEK